MLSNTYDCMTRQNYAQKALIVLLIAFLGGLGLVFAFPSQTSAAMRIPVVGSARAASTLVIPRAFAGGNTSIENETHGSSDTGGNTADGNGEGDESGSITTGDKSVHVQVENLVNNKPLSGFTNGGQNAGNGGSGGSSATGGVVLSGGTMVRSNSYSSVNQTTVEIVVPRN